MEFNHVALRSRRAGVIPLTGKQIERERKSEDKCQFSKWGLGIEGTAFDQIKAPHCHYFLIFQGRFLSDIGQGLD